MFNTGCMAMTCSTCAVPFCFLCLETQHDKTLCHTHVRNCRLNPNQGSYFVNRSGYCRAHRTRQISQIQRALEDLCPEWRANVVVIEALNNTKALLQSNGISSDDVTAETVVPLLPHDQQNRAHPQGLEHNERARRAIRDLREALEPHKWRLIRFSVCCGIAVLILKLAYDVNFKQKKAPFYHPKSKPNTNSSYVRLFKGMCSFLYWSIGAIEKHKK